MADPQSQPDPGSLDASTKLGKIKDVKDSVSFPSYSYPYPGKQKEIMNLPFKPQLTHLKKLDLSGRCITALPQGLDNEIEELNLSNIPLTHIDLYPIHNLCRLKKLDLSSCGLEALSSDLFEDIHEMEELNLSNNPLTDIDPYLICNMRRLKKLDLSGCGLETLPSNLFQCFYKMKELNLSNNSLTNFDLYPIRYLRSLKKLDLSRCGLKKLPADFSKNFHEMEELNLSGNPLTPSDLYPIRFMHSLKKLNGIDLSTTTFKDAIHTKNSGDATVVPTSIPKETWLDEFCRIRKSEKLTIETYHSMLESLKILATLVGDNVESCSEQKFTLKQCCSEIQRYLNNIELPIGRYTDRNSHLVRAIFYLNEAVSGLISGTIHPGQAMGKCSIAFKEAFKAFSQWFSIKDGLLAAELKIISGIMLNLTKPEVAIPYSLQFLQELHEQHAVRELFSSQDDEVTDSVLFYAKSVFKMNKILFKFVQVFFKPPPTVEDWPVTIRLLDMSIYNPLIDTRLMDAKKVASRKTKLDICEVDNRLQNPATDVTGYNFMITESPKETPYSRIIVDQKGGCFSLPEVCGFLLFPPNAVDEKVTLKCSRVRRKDCQVKPPNGEVLVSRILKIEPEGVTFKKPVTVLLSHSLDEDQGFLCFYELIVENLSAIGCQELKTKPISSTEDVPNEISNKGILVDYLPLAKATIQETCTLAAATRAKSDQILIPTNRCYVFCKQYGNVAELKITFPADVTEKILSLKVQLFPADAVMDKDIRSNKTLVCGPIIRVSGQTTSFLKAVNVELTYSHSDVANIEEEFLPVGKTIQFTTEYGLLLRNHNETKSEPNWQALDESNDVSIERSGKDQLKFSFSVKHFSDVQPVVKTSAVSHVPPTNTGMVDMNNPAIHNAIVLAVHETGSSPKTLHSILAPKILKHKLHSKWKVEPLHFQEPLKCEEPIYFCVPMSDTNESDHLFLKDYTLRFDPEDESELPNNTTDDVDLQAKYMRFLKDRECNNGKNHFTQNDCRAKVAIHIPGRRSVQTSTENLEIVHGRESPQEYNVSSGQAETLKSDNELSEVIIHRCELFEKTVESLAMKELEIKDPKGGKATKYADIAGSTATIVVSVASGITIAMSVPTFGATAFVSALVGAAVVAIKIRDKHKIESKAKVVNSVVTKEEEEKVSSYLSFVVKDVAKELSRIFEYQLLQLEDKGQVKILAECAVDLMLDLRKDDTFDRNTLLRKVLQNGQIKKKKLVTKTEEIKWSAPNVFRKPGLRRMIFEKNVAKFEYFVKPNGSCKTWKYGYRGQFLELKKYDGENDGENPPNDETHSKDRNCAAFCEECSSNCQNYRSGHYFSESDIDSQYTVNPREALTYHPVHILIQCPNILDRFQHLQEKPSLASFLKMELGPPKDHLVHPVYRPHSPRKVCDLRKSDLTGSDFSHSDFTNSCLEECDFTKCVMLFAKLAGANFSGSTFCDTLISHSNLKNVVADHCEFTKTSLVYSCVTDAHLESVEPSIGGNCLDGTNIDGAIRTKKKELNCNEEEQPRERVPESNDSSIGAGNSPDYCEGTSTILANADDASLGTRLSGRGGSCLNETNVPNTNMGGAKPSETLV